MNKDQIDRRIEGARRRNKTFLVRYQKHTGKSDLLEFLDEFRDEAQMQAAGRYWLNEGYVAVKMYSLFDEETDLQRVRRLRQSKNWEDWRANV